MKSLSPFLQQRVLPVLFVLLFSFTSCRIRLVSDYDEKLSQQIDEVAKQVDEFYLTLLETTQQGNANRAFSLFNEKYIKIEVELNSLLAKNKAKALNESSTKVCEIIIKLFKKHKAEHKRDGQAFDNASIIIIEKQMQDVFYAFKVAEEGKKLAANPPATE